MITQRRGEIEAVVEITREVDAEVPENPYTVEAVIHEYGGHEIYVSLPGQPADKLNSEHEYSEDIREVADKMLDEYGDAWFREAVQYEESRRRLIAAGAEDVD